MGRAFSVDENGLKKGAWSREEDDKLIAHIHKHGHSNWRQLPKFAGLSRCGKSCRLRWMNYLRPDVKRGKFSKEEEDLIIQMHQEIGTKWSKIAGKLPGRSDNEIKNHWHTNLKKRVKRDTASSSSEVKHHRIKTSKQVVINETKKLEAESVNNNSSHPVILESSPLPPKTASENGSSPDSSNCTSCSEFSYYFSPDYYAYVTAAGMNCAEDYDHSLNNSVTMFEESNDDFWTRPFEADGTTCNQFSAGDDHLLSSATLDDAWFSSLCDDSMDLLYQVIQELPWNN